MIAVPSASYSLTVRLEILNRPGMLGKVTSAIGKGGGDIGAIDLVQVGKTTVTRDITFKARDDRHGAQVVEHLPPERLPEMIRLAASRLARGGVLAIETPNPECLAIFATHFFLDPTHTRPIPSSLLVFYLEEAGFGGIEVERFAPDGLDYAVSCRKL